ncbi:hypothetical protein CUROG_00515 [Corynebacterium urogenitale]|uniref:Uncharacterized protein n=1 Tax=Corynebacterium urogenitale TaxID=2487892 RepID=A0A5J6Z7B3_9CORY|nr:hypothetical protein CUROG_00515 [Corynebacterium urogenitale]
MAVLLSHQSTTTGLALKEVKTGMVSVAMTTAPNLQTNSLPLDKMLNSVAVALDMIFAWMKWTE